MSRWRAVSIACPHEIQPTGGLTRGFRHKDGREEDGTGSFPPSSYPCPPSVAIGVGPYFARHFCLAHYLCRP